MLLKRREVSIQECLELYALMKDERVFPYVREKAETFSRFLFNTKSLAEKESRGEAYSRTILNEVGRPIGCISLFDVENGEGFLATWLGAEYHGMGYNRLAKEAFFEQLFFSENVTVETIFLKIRKTNIRSRKAALKLPYATFANEIRTEIYRTVNGQEETFDLFSISKKDYEHSRQRQAGIVTA